MWETHNLEIDLNVYLVEVPQPQIKGFLRQILNDVLSWASGWKRHLKFFFQSSQGLSHEYFQPISFSSSRNRDNSGHKWTETGVSVIKNSSKVGLKTTILRPLAVNISLESILSLL